MVACKPLVILRNEYCANPSINETESSSTKELECETNESELM